MGFSDTFKKLVGIEEIEDEFDEEELQAEKERISKESARKPSVSEYKAPKQSSSKTSSGEAPKAVPIERRVSVAGTSAFKLVVIEPKSFDECPKLVDSLIFIFAPESVDIAANQDERGFDFGGGKNPWR